MQGFFLFFEAFFNSNRNGNRRADHRVVAHLNRQPQYNNWCQKIVLKPVQISKKARIFSKTQSDAPNFVKSKCCLFDAFEMSANISIAYRIRYYTVSSRLQSLEERRDYSYRRYERAENEAEYLFTEG